MMFQQDTHHTAQQTYANGSEIYQLSQLPSQQHLDNINAYYDSPAVRLFEELAQQQIHLGYWDDKYPQIPLAQAAQRLTQIIIDQIEIPRDAKFLDIGCGCGQPAIEIIKQKHCYLDGITLNPQQGHKATELAMSEGLTHRASFNVADATALPYDNHVFDSALLLESIHHIGHAEALSEAFRVLKPGGTILIADGVVLKDKIKKADKTLLAETFVSKSLLTESAFCDAMKKAGFIDIEVLDLTAGILPSWDKLSEACELNKTKIVRENSEQFYQSLLNFWQEMRMVWSQNAKYLILKARKIG
jgi:cyclopropane fatty-acyl-phospholipid synthase-like methyltransferase